MLAGWLFAIALLGGQTGPAASATVTRLAGTDVGSGIAYVLLSMGGVGPGGGPARLTAQCTRTAAGKGKFELLFAMAEVGMEGPELRFVPPWRASEGNPFAPRLDHVMVTMDFVGYTKVKPVKRQWDLLPEMPGEMRYATPGMSSGNMEEVAFYMQYVKALPTLKLTVPGKGTAVFETAKWQTAVRAEPLCRMSGL